MVKSFFINCDQASTICDKNQYGEATFLDKVKLKIHCLMCKICPLYSKQNIFLSLLFNHKAKNSKETNHCLSADDKLAFKKKLESKK